MLGISRHSLFRTLFLTFQKISRLLILRLHLLMRSYFPQLSARLLLLLFQLLFRQFNSCYYCCLFSCRSANQAHQISINVVLFLKFALQNLPCQIYQLLVRCLNSHRCSYIHITSVFLQSILSKTSRATTTTYSGNSHTYHFLW